MGDAQNDHEQAARLPEGDVVAVLLGQHGRIKELFGQVKQSGGEARKNAFDELRSLLAVHETAEEMIVRPVSADTAGKAVADARNAEEAEANKVLAQLEKMDVSSAEFESLLERFEQSVLQHAEKEETEEFPAVRAGCSEDQLEKMGRRLLAVEKVAPTHPHPMAAGSPTAQWMTGPFASMVDRVKDALSKS
ncbi:hemerythrin domain-containing protein [Streptomyces sp. NPDC015220]|uniref:hemerythrin domain-containing protein n=1 Tax=Streptomyces sp. NPDC015220 TaxID=3364947 RepID=UPI0036F9DF31